MYQKGKTNVEIQKSCTDKDPGFGDLLIFLFFFLNSRVLQNSDLAKIILLMVDPDGKAE